jgi:hypothetical protein
MSIDLLGSVYLDKFEYDTPKDDQLTDSQKDALSVLATKDFVTDAFPLESVLLATAVCLLGIVQTYLLFMTVCPSPLTLAILYGLVTGFALAMLAALYAIQEDVLTGRMTPGNAFGWLFLGVVPMLIFGGIGDTFLYVKFYRTYWQMRGTIWGFRGLWLIGLALYLSVIQWYLLSLVCHMCMCLYEMSIVYYDAANL